jgi:hypothetical protein
VRHSLPCSLICTGTRITSQDFEVHQSLQRIIYQLVLRPMITKPLHIELPQWKDVMSLGDSLLELKPGHNSVLGKEFVQESSKVKKVEPAL